MSDSLDEYHDLTSNNKFVNLRYPDLKEQGSLRKLLQLHLDAIGSTLKVDGKDTTTDGQCSCWAFVRSETRMSQPTVAVMERLFLLDFWDRGVCLGHVNTSSPEEAAKLLDAWIGQNTAPRQLKQQFPFVEFSEAADAYVAGAAVYVEQKWERLHKTVVEDKFFSVLASVVQTAHSHPILGKLMPFTSMNRLGFSQCTGYPFLVPCPFIIPASRPDDVSNGAESQYEVQDDNGKTLARGNASVIVDYIVSCLPPDCGPAFLGSADELPK